MEMKIGQFLLSFPSESRFETFDLPNNYYGVVFRTPGYRYEVIHSLLGTRLLINGSEGESRDIPFHLGTAHLLPDFIATKQL